MIIATSLYLTKMALGQRKPPSMPFQVFPSSSPGDKLATPYLVQWSFSLSSSDKKIPILDLDADPDKSPKSNHLCWATPGDFSKIRLQLLCHPAKELIP